MYCKYSYLGLAAIARIRTTSATTTFPVSDSFHVREERAMQISLPPLPYPSDALEPFVSRSTLEVHHGKHHRGYVDKVNALAEQAHLADKSLEQIVVRTAGHDNHRALFQNAAQAWNHAFYWDSLRPGGGAPRGDIAVRIETDFGGYGHFAEQFAAAAVGQFGSGWAWLVLSGDALKITHTANADTPLAHGQIPLLTVDVWEHAYYLDYQNRRADYVAAVLKNLLNWDFANANLTRHRAAAGVLKRHLDQARTGAGRDPENAPHSA
jgi:superoxide dismutase, Fe-Mn family